MATVEVVQQYPSSAVDEKLSWFHVDVDAPCENVQGLEEKGKREETFERRSKPRFYLAVFRVLRSRLRGLGLCASFPFYCHGIISVYCLLGGSGLVVYKLSLIHI